MLIARPCFGQHPRRYTLGQGLRRFEVLDGPLHGLTGPMAFSSNTAPHWRQSLDGRETRSGSGLQRAVEKPSGARIPHLINSAFS